MATTMRRRTPASLWIVGGLATVWNAFGAYDYLMTRMRNMDYLAAQMPGTDAAAMLAYIDSFPVWAQIGWGMGVWFGLLGSLLLLARSRWAVTSFLLSLIGMALSFGYQFTHPSDLAATHEGPMAFMPYAIILVGIGLLLFALAMRKKGALR
jgi:hypothetical protein